MKKQLRDYLLEFNNYSDKTELADIIIKNFEIETYELDDIKFIEERFKIKLTEEEKFKLKMLAKSKRFGDLSKSICVE